MFDFSEYLYIIQFYKNDFKMSEWVLVIIAIVVLAILLALILALLYLIIRKYIRFRKTLVEQESMLNEIGELNNKVASLVKEKEDILAMKVSQLGLKPGEDETEERSRLSTWTIVFTTKKYHPTPWTSISAMKIAVQGVGCLLSRLKIGVQAVGCPFHLQKHSSMHNN